MSKARLVGDRVLPSVVDAGFMLSNQSDVDVVDAAALIEVMTERIRYTRPAITASDDGHAGSHWLPLNRKERYFTATVLPMICASDGFAHVGRLLQLCGLPEVAVQAGLDGDQELVFYTEYGFAESVFTEADRARWPDPAEGDTPDVVIAGDDWLVAIEAKMFHNPSHAGLEAQMARQAKLVDYWSSKRHMDPRRVAHVLLLPRDLAAETQPASRYITWEQVRDTYAAVAPRYWVRQLNLALAAYAELRSKAPTANDEARYTGQKIVERHAAGEFQYDHVGRAGGASGKLLAGDVSSGTWRERVYQVRSGPPAGNNPHWMTLADFLAATGH